MPKIKRTQKPLTKTDKAVLILVETTPMKRHLVAQFAKENSLNFITYTEKEWATLEEIDQYIQEEDLSKQILNLPIGANKDFSLDKLQEETIKKMTQIKNLNINETAKRLKIGRATLYRRLEKYGLNLKTEREKQTKKQAA